MLFSEIIQNGMKVEASRVQLAIAELRENRITYNPTEELSKTKVETPESLVEEPVDTLLVPVFIGRRSEG